MSLAPAACDDLLASLPVEVRGPLDGMALGGQLGAHARLTIDLAAPAGDGAILLDAVRRSVHRGGRAAGGRRVHAARRVRPPVRRRQPRADRPRRARLGPGSGDLPPRVRGAFVSAEDGRFWEHAGFDAQQIARSLEIDLRERRLARGGSTISQQLIKNAFLTHRRTLDRKVQEAILTWRLEERLDKRQILERYLNIIELGPRVFGIGAAARYWFDTSARELTTRQAAFLAALTSEPTSMSRRVRRARRPRSRLRRARRRSILRAMKRDGVIGPETYDLARHATLEFSLHAVVDDR